MKQGDIYLVNFSPSVGHEYKKMRPAVIVQYAFLDSPSLVTVMPLTSKIEKCQVPDILIVKDRKNRLFVDSVVRVRHITTFDTQRLVKKIGAVESPVLRKIRGYMRVHFGL